MLNPNVIVDIDDDVDNEIEIIPFVLEFGHASGSTIVVFNDWTHSYICFSGNSDLEIGQTFSCKNDLVNIVIWWHVIKRK